jgi:hypothetical protein
VFRQILERKLPLIFMLLLHGADFVIVLAQQLL